MQQGPEGAGEEGGKGRQAYADGGGDGGEVQPSKRRVQEWKGEGGKGTGQQSIGRQQQSPKLQQQQQKLPQPQQERQQALQQQHTLPQQQQMLGRAPPQQPRPSPPPAAAAAGPFPVLRRMRTKSYAMRKRELVAAQQRLRGSHTLPLSPHLASAANSSGGVLSSGGGGMRGKISGKTPGGGSGKAGLRTRTPSPLPPNPHSPQGDQKSRIPTTTPSGATYPPTNPNPLIAGLSPSPLPSRPNQNTALHTPPSANGHNAALTPPRNGRTSNAVNSAGQEPQMHAGAGQGKDGPAHMRPGAPAPAPPNKHTTAAGGGGMRVLVATAAVTKERGGGMALGKGLEGAGGWERWEEGLNKVSPSPSFNVQCLGSVFI